MDPRRHAVIATCLTLCLVVGDKGAAAQTPAASPAGLDEAMRLGRIGALATVCSLRDAAWAQDLRRAQLQALTRSTARSDAEFRAAPDSDKAVAILSYAEDEALETFAEAAPQATCEPLRRDPDLGRADRAVDAYRRAGGPRV